MAAGSAEAGAAAAPASPAPTLLLVDDEPGVAATLAAVLADEGYRVETASSVDDALARIARTSFTAAVLDLNVGHDDGLVVLARLKETSPATVAVVLTGYASLASALGAIRAGVDGYLVKPCDVEELKATLARGRERAERAAAERAALEGAVDEARERLTLVVEHLPVGVMLAEAPTGRVLLANRAVDRIWRGPFRAAGQRKASSRTTYAGYHPDGRPYLPADWPLARAIARGEVVRGELIEIVRGDGTRGAIRNHAAPLRDADDRVVAGVVVFEDVTEEMAARRASGTAADRTARLERLAGALARALRPVDAARAVLRELGPALGASAGLVALADPDGAALEIVASIGFPPELIAQWRRFPADASLASALAYRSGRLVTFDSRAAASTLPELAARMAAAGHDAVAAAPLRVDDRSLGAFVVCVERGRRFDEAERDFLMAVAAQCAQALDRARLYDQTERAERHQRLVADASRLLAEARLDQAAVLEALARTVAGEVADTCTIHLVADDRTTLRPAAVHDPDPARADLRRALLAEHPLRVGEGVAGRVVLSGQPAVVAGERAAFEAELKPAYRPHADRLFFASVAVVPLRGQQGVVGALAAERLAPGRPFTGADVDLLQEIADRAALAIENAALYDRARRAERMQRLLADATGALAGTLDYEATLADVARLAVPALADWCVVYLGQADGSVRRIAVAHADPAREGLLWRLGAEYRLDRDPPDPIAGVVASGRSILAAEVAPAALERHARDAEHLGVMRELAPRSVMVVPLVGREAVLGALSFSSAAAERRYDRADLAVAEELGRRCALAVENARLYAVSRQELVERRRAEEAQRRATARTQRLQEITRQLSGSLEADEVLQNIAESAASLLEAPVGAVFLLDRGDPEADFVLAAAHGIEDAPARLPRLPRHASLAGRAFDEARTLVVDDASTTPGTALPQLLTGQSTGSEIAAPIQAGDERLGVVKAFSPIARRFTTGDADLLTALAAAAAVALTNARLYREAREAIAARDEFLSIASHELRTPVTSLRGNAQLLARARERGQLDEARIERFVRSISDSTARLATLIDDLLDVSRIQSGQLALRPREIDMRDLVGRLAEGRAAAVGSGHRIETTLPAAACQLQADPDRLAQVIENLLDNAIKYSPEGGVVWLTLEHLDGEAHLRVADDGIGLPAGSAEAIFEPFGRAANAVERALPGMGLGLYICRSIVEQHGGHLWAESPGEERGTTLHMVLPAPED